MASATEEIVNLTLLREALDNEKTPALILTVSLFTEAKKEEKKKKQQSVNMPSRFMTAL